MDLSIIIPCYRSAGTIETVVSEIRDVFARRSNLKYEIILVNDGSPDHTYEVIKRLVADNNDIVGIDIAKNQGQHSAVMAGMRHSLGNLVMVSDDDGQTPIEVFLRMIDKIDEGYDIVCADYEGRGKRSLIRTLGSAVNDWMMKRLLDKPDDVPTSINFVAKRFVIDEMLRYENPFPYITGQMIRTTHNIGSVVVDQHDRLSGESGYNFRSLLALWTAGVTTFSVKPLRFATFAGASVAFIGFIMALILVIGKVAGRDMATGWTSLITVNLLIGGMLMLMLGIVGEYLGRIYLSINKSPQYVIREIIGRHDEKDIKADKE